jgi:hypothetical protein
VTSFVTTPPPPLMTQPVPKYLPLLAHGILEAAVHLPTTPRVTDFEQHSDYSRSRNNTVAVAIDCDLVDLPDAESKSAGRVTLWAPPLEQILSDTVPDPQLIRNSYHLVLGL